VLFWGILSALVMRGAMIAGGAFLIAQAHWVLYVFGAFLIVAGIRLATRRGHAIHPDRNPLLKLIGRIIPVTSEYHGPRFFVAAGDGGWRRAATPLFVSLVLVESTDLLFALDSIPAIFAVTTDPFLVYTSNVCAILGLRALYFLLAGMIHRFRYLQIGLSIVLVFVGAKMLAADVYEIPIAVSLLVIAATIGLSALASVLVPDRSIAADRSGAM